jgi:hypothetical protein
LKISNCSPLAAQRQQAFDTAIVQLRLVMLDAV